MRQCRLGQTTNGRGGGHRELVTGMGSSIEFVMRFARWADDMGARLTAEAVSKRYDVSRATGYRWVAAYRAAKEAMA